MTGMRGGPFRSCCRRSAEAGAESKPVLRLSKGVSRTEWRGVPSRGKGDGVVGSLRRVTRTP